ncbi:MAG: hydrogenase nickel incorporation protein HypB, partial [Azospira sp.]|nr:hydrogenase nickel incorporation protein HypB [Azospira sp.]
MCTDCGCAAGETRIDGEVMDEHWHVHADGTAHAHPPAHVWRPRATPAHRQAGSATAVADHYAHEHPHEHPHEHSHRQHAAADAASPAVRRVRIERDILARNDAAAAENRARFRAAGIFALNLVSSPGSGKTTLLCRTVEALGARHSPCVIEGDQQTDRDAERIRATGAPAVQINTGKGCHLDAAMVGRAVERLAPADRSVLFIENVGNLVCPAAFDLGEAHKVVILSVTEGEDKPLKYPDMFR